MYTDVLYYYQPLQRHLKIIITPFLPPPEPPGAPRNLQHSDVTNTSVKLTWDSPSYEGGRSDTFYNVYTSTTANSGLTQSNIEPVFGNNFFVTGLIPNTFNQVSVVAENGVSSQAGEEYLRTAVTFVITSIGGYIKLIDLIYRYNYYCLIIS